MGLIDPLNLLYALSLVALVLIYLRARARATFDVSSLLLFEATPAPARRVSRFRLDLLFWLEALVLAALTLALSGLYIRLAQPHAAAYTRFMIFDVGAAMDARASGESRLDQARAQALGLLRSAGIGEQLGIITYATRATVVQPPTTDQVTLREALARLRPYDVATQPAALASALMHARPAARIDLFTDREPPAALLAESVSATAFQLHLVGGSLDNVAIVSLEPGTLGSVAGRCLVRNFTAHLRFAELRISVNGKDIKRTQVALSPRSQSIVSFGPLTEAGVVEARLLDPDALAADNTRYAYAASARGLRVLVLSPSQEVRQDLAAVLRGFDPGCVVAAADPAKLDLAHPESAFGGGNAPDLVVMHDFYDRRVAAGSILMIYPPVGQGTDRGVRVLGELPTSQLDERSDIGTLPHPLLLGPARELALGPTLEPLAYGGARNRTERVPLAAGGEDSKGRVGLLAFDIRDHRLLDPDMLDLLVLTIDTLRALASPEQIRIVPTGAYAAMAVTGTAHVLAPDGSTLTLRPDATGRIYLPVMEAGRYRIEAGNKKIEVYANYFDASESNLSVQQVEPALPRRASVAAARPAADQTQPWPMTNLLLALALAAFLAESTVMLARAMAGRRHHV